MNINYEKLLMFIDSSWFCQGLIITLILKNIR